jgi:molybdopterin-containing oxidoreductase family membrane subunit
MATKAMDMSEELSKPSHPRWFTVGMGIGAAMLLALLFGMYRILIVGHDTLATSDDVPWNIFVVVYAFGISSIGLSYIASLGLLLGFKSFDVLARRSLFLALILAPAAMSSIILDMGNPLRAPFIFFFASPTSALAIVAISITAYVVLIALEFYYLLKRGHHSQIVKVLAVGTFLLATIAHSHLGAIFGMTTAKDLWSGPYYPIYFLISAFTTSAAIIIPVTVVTYRMRGMQMSANLIDGLTAAGKLLIGLLLITIFTSYWKLYSGAYAGKSEVKMLFSGAYAMNFWLFEVVIGFVIPLFMLLVSMRAESVRRANLMAAASVFALVGLFVSRYDFVIIGQLITSSSKLLSGIGSGGDYMMQLASYSPNITEILTSIGLLGITWVAYLAGVRYIDLDEDEQ